MQEADFQALIREYLKRRGWDDLEKSFKEKVSPSSEFMLSNRLNIHRGVVEQLVEHFSISNGPEGDVESYDKLVSWVDNSLDIYRVSLFMPCVHYQPYIKIWL